MVWCAVKFYPYCIALHERDTYLTMTCEISIQEHELSVLPLFFSYAVDNFILNYSNSLQLIRYHVWTDQNTIKYSEDIRSLGYIIHLEAMVGKPQVSM